MQLDALNTTVEVLRKALSETKKCDSVADARQAADKGLRAAGETALVLEDRRYRCR